MRYPLLAVLALVAPATALAQAPRADRAHPSVSLTLAGLRPVGALGDNIASGYGGFAAGLLPLTANGWLSLRADIGLAEYGRESRRSAFSEAVGDRVEVKVRTANMIMPASVGLQLAMPTGAVRPYLHGGLGVQAFYTESSVAPTNGGMALISDVNQSDVAFAWTFGGGVTTPLLNGATRVLLDISAQYIHGGTAQYLAPGSISDLPGGRISISPMESATHFVAFRVGARIGR
jgi:opacity protein-like surface antigen